MIDLLLVAVLAVLFAAAIGYIVKERRSGAACVGCPHGRNCPHHKAGCSCHHPHH